MMERREVFSRNLGVWGADHQARLEQATILIAGVGGLGGFVAEILVRSGVGCLILVDDGIVDPPDLNRQILYTRADLDRPKVEAATERLSAIHGLTRIIPVNKRISDGGMSLSDWYSGEVDGLMDCLDNYSSRYGLELMLTGGMFLVHGGVQEDYGQVTTIQRGRTPSLASLFANAVDSPDPPAVCPQAVACIGSIMSYEAINNIRGRPGLMNRLLIIELSDFTQSTISLG